MTTTVYRLRNGDPASDEEMQSIALAFGFSSLRHLELVLSGEWPSALASGRRSR